jgi:hypothetical protein
LHDEDDQSLLRLWARGTRRGGASWRVGLFFRSRRQHGASSGDRIRTDDVEFRQHTRQRRIAHVEQRPLHAADADGRESRPPAGADSDLANTSGRSVVLTLQSDGNLVVHNAHTLWATGTSGAGTYLVVQNDENVVLYNGAAQEIWATNTEP